MTGPVWDVFCSVVDNYGDAAAGWRLASQLAAEHGIRPRLWIDRPDVLHALRPEVADTFALQSVAGVEVRGWRPDPPASDWPEPGVVAVDILGCGLPAPYLARKAALATRSLWITTEYLSAEPWVLGHHGLASPHPATGLERWFFFPGFVPGTGGLPREAGFESRRLKEQGPEGAARLWRQLGFPPVPEPATVVSVFGYGGPALAATLEAWAASSVPVVLAVTRCPLATAVGAWVGVEAAPGTVARRGPVEARFLPFLGQHDYDRLLWNADWNFVRGEDSLGRALWARRPLVWQPYVQEDGAHRTKLAAFADWYAGEGALRATWLGFAEAWSGLAAGGSDASWARLAAESALWLTRAGERADALAAAGEFTAQLVDFCRKRLN